MWEQYNRYKSIHKQLAKVKPGKREQFEQRHSRELILYDAAARYLKDLKDNGEAITPKTWQLEIDQLTAGKQTDTLAMKSMREELKAVERLRKTAEQLSRQERDKSHDRGSRSGKGYRVLAYPCQVRRVSRHTFAYRKTAVQVSPYGGRRFICRTSRCVCRCGPASAPEHHPLCDRQAASPGEYDIPDGLPNRRTGHGHGSYPAAVRPSPATLRPAPTAQFSSHAYSSFVVFLKLVVYLTVYLVSFIFSGQQTTRQGHCSPLQTGLLQSFPLPAWQQSFPCWAVPALLQRECRPHEATGARRC